MQDTIQFPIIVEDTEIRWARILVGHSSQYKCLYVRLDASGLSGKQKRARSLTAKLVEESGEVELSTYGATKTRVPLAWWQAFADRLPVEVFPVSRTTVELTPQLVKMARDVVAKRRAAPTDDEWAAEVAGALAVETAPQAPPPDVAPQEFADLTDHRLVRSYILAAADKGSLAGKADAVRAEMVARGWTADDLRLVRDAARRWRELDRIVQRIMATTDWDWPLLRATKLRRQAVVDETAYELQRRQRARLQRRQQEEAGQLSLF